MIFSFFIFLFLVALILIALGYYSDTDVLKIVAYGFIFMLGVMLFAPTFFGNVEDCEYLGNYTNSYYVYGDNYSSYHWDYVNAPSPSEDGVRLFHVVEEPTYKYTCQEIENKAFGFWIAVLGVLGFASVFFQRKGGRIEQ
ncbi:MAG: hypothetical protein GY853_02170 [PVC group bacterium]|nr:hypothetical protein [PVC group bacterium]